MHARLAPLALWLALLLPLAACASEPDPNLARYAVSPLQIATSAGRLHNLDVYLAVSADERRQGLMYVRKLPANHGMLFLNPRSTTLSMWMKNTYLPLDMLFVRDDGSIASIVADTTPHSLDTISSDSPVMAVLELNAGTAARLKIHPGDRLLHNAFAKPRQGTRANPGATGP